MPTLVLLAGPNGAGKTTFINGFLRERAEAFRFVNPDEVARGLTGEGRTRDLAAGRRVLERLDELAAERADFVLETTLATRSHAVRIRDWKAAGYRFELIYLRLPSADHSVARVASRKAATAFRKTPCDAASNSASNISTRPTNLWPTTGRSTPVAGRRWNC